MIWSVVWYYHKRKGEVSDALKEGSRRLQNRNLGRVQPNAGQHGKGWDYERLTTPGQHQRKCKPQSKISSLRTNICLSLQNCWHCGSKSWHPTHSFQCTAVNSCRQSQQMTKACNTFAQFRNQKIAQLHNKNNQIQNRSITITYHLIVYHPILSKSLQHTQVFTEKSLHPLDLVGVPRGGDQSIPKAAKFLQPVSPALLQDCAHRSDSRFILPCSSAHSQMIHSKFVRFKDHKRQIQNPSTSFKIV